MNLLCRVGFHRTMPSNVWNDGHYFSACSACGTQMIRVPNGKWTPVPANLRVVWRPRTSEDIVWPSHVLSD